MKPNIVYMFCDDLGYGDVSCLNPERGKIPTPCVDKLASQGMVFTDCHSGSAVCTPSRYGVLTGRYAWRTRKQSGVIHILDPADAEPLIARDRLTVGALLKQHGYHTAAIGKWHLGMLFDPPMDETMFGDGTYHNAGVPVGAKVLDGPVTRGFDYFYGYEHARSMRTLIENDTVIDEIEPVEMLPRITQKSIEYIEERAADAANGKPFFLYLPFSSPHLPVVPSDEWKGKSELGIEYADFVMQTDACAGEVLKALDKHGLSDNTLVIFTSDNGCSPVIGPGIQVDALEEKGHYPSAYFRGYKSEIWDGGHRIPFIARWPGEIEAGSECNQLACLGDLMATCADILGAKLSDNAAEDSVSMLPALKGTAKAPLREAVVHHSSKGMFSIRTGKWKLIFGCGHGGSFRPYERGDEPAMQLYDLDADISEEDNRYPAEPAVVEELTKILEGYVAEGRSTPGARQQNDVPVDIYRLMD